MPVSASKIVLRASRTSSPVLTVSPSSSAAGQVLLERVRPRHPDDHALELPVGVEIEEVAVVHVVLRAVLQVTDVALLGGDLPGGLLDNDVPDLVAGRRRTRAGGP